ncbi:MarR family winged helix-turn-helix transcriptional regulator [Mycolicibacterium houstonense]|uniref:MarR family winged helix-turn-helix transcriptional regulator n=1 Tax=Mycolicibacterium houstonense TaxID=146021 RepID=UPI00082DED23|nr:MarR family transcriptional regulator [Mycolicibacterium houstonense]
MSSKAPKLTDFLCFAIYSANLAYGKAYKQILDRHGITYTQYIAIVALSEQDHQTVGGLGEKLFLESNTLTPILKKLETLGFVTRRRDPGDERQVIVSLTDAGRELREEALETELVAATGLSMEELATMQRGVSALRDNLREYMQAAVDSASRA